MIALLLLLLTQPSSSQRNLCFPSERNRLEHKDAVSGQVTKVDLSPLCNSQGYSFNGSGTSGQTFFFNVGGNASFGCSDYKNILLGPEYESWGMATQLLQPQRGVNPNGCLADDNATSCLDYTFGGPACCSPRRCEVVAGPFFTLAWRDPSNPATGGVVLTTSGWPDSPTNDNIACPMQAPGLPRLRQFVLTLQCDPAGAAGQLQVNSYNEASPYCVFRVAVSARDACGLVVPSATPTPSASGTPSATPSASPPPPSASPTPTPTPSAQLPPPPPAAAAAAQAPSAAAVAGSNVGFVVLGAALAVGVQLLLAYGRAALSASGSGSERLGLLGKRVGVATPAAVEGHYLFQGGGGAASQAAPKAEAGFRR